LYQDKELTLRPIMEEDLYRLWTLAFKEEAPEWKKWDAPYYPYKPISYEEFLTKKEQYVDRDDRWSIIVNEKLIGIIGYYWEHEPSRWLEMGIVIYDPNYWSGGYGTRVIKLWMDHLFKALPLVRVGYTTWSGNERMIKVGEKLGMTMEGRMRKCRYYNGVYYDSIRMGILREEWEDFIKGSKSINGNEIVQ
jgi:RimJ/RimL family protein N-acetyltransferase